MIQVFDCEQGSPEWFQSRLGIPTSSEFASILASGKDGKESKTRKTYMLKLAGEIVTGEVAESFSNFHTERGHIMEPEARELYEFGTDTKTQQVGFIRNGAKGCSPDSLIGVDGLLEIKTKLPHLLIEAMLRDDFPPEHKAQCQGALWVSEREWVDIAIYWPKLPLVTRRAYRDEKYIATLSDAVDKFNEELAAVVERIREFQIAA